MSPSATANVAFSVVTKVITFSNSGLTFSATGEIYQYHPAGATRDLHVKDSAFVVWEDFIKFKSVHT